MNDLYYHSLGLTDPWYISNLTFDVKAARVDIWIDYKASQFPCPQCNTLCPVYDQVEERTWRHMDSCQYKTYVHCRIPRIRCKEHSIIQVSVPWAEERARFTALFQIVAIDLLKECTVSGAARILRITWDLSLAYHEACSYKRAASKKKE